MPQTQSPHDALFKRVFSSPENAEGLLRSALPEALVHRIDWSTLRPEPGSFVDEELRAAHADLLFSVDFGGKPALVYLLLEHQSTNDRMMTFRMLVYIVRIWDRWREQNPNAKHLPAIIPLVVHHSDTGWSGATELRDVIDLDDEQWRLLEPFLPRLRILVDDLSFARDAELRARSRTAFAELGLRMLQRARYSVDFLKEMRGWLGTFRKVAAAPNGVTALAALLEYALSVTDVPTATIQRFAHQLGALGDEAYMTGAQELHAAGKLQGIVEGQARVVLRLLKRKFGELPDSVVERVNASTTEELDTCAERVLSAESLDDVFQLS